MGCGVVAKKEGSALAPLSDRFDCNARRTMRPDGQGLDWFRSSVKQKERAAGALFQRPFPWQQRPSRDSQRSLSGKRAFSRCV